MLAICASAYVSADKAARRANAKRIIRPRRLPDAVSVARVDTRRPIHIESAVESILLALEVQS